MEKGNKYVKMSFFLVFLTFMALTMPNLGYAEYPEKPITIIHGWAPGGMADTFTRLLADAASKKLGQPIIVENKPGGHGIVAAHTIVRAKPDGYTLGGGVSSQFLIVPNLRKVDYDPLNDPTQIMVFFNYDLGLAVRSDSPWKTWEDLKNYAKQNPGKVRYGTPGVGDMQSLAFEMVGQKEGIKWVHVPFPGAKEPVIALLGGHIDGAIVGPPDLVPHIKTGELRFLLAFNKGRWPIAPNVPHIGELGYDNTFSYFSIWGPKGLPEPIRSKLENVFREAMKDQRFIETANTFQVTIVYVPGKEYAEILKEKFPKYKKIIQDLGIGELYKK
jgi:tripartite-type tricarboxylate transporter receptor subunit TctC